MVLVGEPLRGARKVLSKVNEEVNKPSPGSAMGMVA